MNDSTLWAFVCLASCFLWVFFLGGGVGRRSTGEEEKIEEKPSTS